MSAKDQYGFTLLKALVVIAIVIVAVIVVSNAVRPAPGQTTANNLAASVTPTTAGIGTAYSGTITGPGATTATLAGPAWLSLSLGQLSGTPGGNDFGTNNFTLTHLDGSGTAFTAGFTITVPNPTLAAVTPPTGFLTPSDSAGGQSNTVDITIAPPPNNGADYSVTYSRVLVQGLADPLNAIPPDTSDSAGNLSVFVVASFGTDYLDHIYVVLAPNDPSNAPLRLGPIDSKPGP